MHRPVIAPRPDSPASHAVGLDLDGTLAVDNGWQGGRIGLPQPGAMDALRTLARHRAVFVYTARPRIWLPEVADWVTWYSGLEAFVDPSGGRAYWTTRGPVLVTSTKLGAACYIDDRAVHHAGNWDDTLATVSRAIGLSPASV
ncbi:hypothetical protein [Kitasatospora cathayae]|uniref:Phosphoheptose isomerase n=1 Tax=Kitasatospora cathayae TaxID=3004092 RepID=A0ABY7QIC7_9ACTN|nr:hypothetical protein [Kitasatospora sp. HUAS 3-15]WBP92005.1 hypothetical protein O1G21_40170 [Kitasatospora sp. HUAS 3-15]